MCQSVGVPINLLLDVTVKSTMFNAADMVFSYTSNTAYLHYRAAASIMTQLYWAGTART